MIYDIVIIGFGISGIITTKNAIGNFENILVLEKEDSFGGCWYSKCYPGVKLQTNKKYYNFSGYSIDSSSNYPNRQEILDYLKNYVETHDINKYVRYNSDVVNIIHNQDNTWMISYNQNNLKESVLTKNLIMCSGIYNTQNKPNIKNLSLFKNTYLNTTDFNHLKNVSYSIFKDKNVFVIGNGPSGCDIACNAVKNGANNVTILYRSKRWIFKRSFQKFFKTNRLFFRTLLHLPNSINIIALYIFFIVVYLCNSYTKEILLPDNFINHRNLVYNDDIYDYFDKGLIKYVQSSNIETTKKSIIIDNIYRKKCDIIVNATGFTTNMPFKIEKFSLPLLYKRVVHPKYNNLAFIGYASSFNWPLVSEIQSLWYMHFLKNNLLDKDKIDIEIKKDYIYTKTNQLEYNDLSINVYEYIDDLLKQCNLNKEKTFIDFLGDDNNNTWIRD